MPDWPRQIYPAGANYVTLDALDSVAHGMNTRIGSSPRCWLRWRIRGSRGLIERKKEKGGAPFETIIETVLPYHPSQVWPKYLKIHDTRRAPSPLSSLHFSSSPPGLSSPLYLFSSLIQLKYVAVFKRSPRTFVCPPIYARPARVKREIWDSAVDSTCFRGPGPRYHAQSDRPFLSS